MKNRPLASFLTLSSLSLLPVLASAQTALARIDGSSTGIQLGHDVAALGDVNNDGATDWIVGAPLDDTGGGDAGMAVVYSGATQAPLHTLFGAAAGAKLGTSVAPLGDLDGDGYPDLLVTSPGTNRVEAYSGVTGLAFLTITSTVDDFGGSLASGGDANGDGVDDILVGAPRADTNGTNSGHAALYSGSTGALIRTHNGVGALVHFGHAVAFIGDLNGDLRAEYMVGAPAPYPGAGYLPYVKVFDGASGTLLWSDGGSHSDAFGHSLCAIDDISGDGRPDVLIGAMQDTGVGCACVGRGFVRALDGATGSLLYQVNHTVGTYVGFGWDIAMVGDMNGNGTPDFASSLPGTDGCWPGFGIEIHDGQDGVLIMEMSAPTEAGHLGASLDFGDTNGDGLGDLILGAPCSQPNGANSGSVYTYTALRRVTIYCTAKTNSLGCTPYIEGVGTPSETVPVPFRIKAFQVLNNKPGILFYGSAPQSIPFQDGRLCVDGPLTRTPVQFSGGNPPPTDCSGAYSIDFNDYIRSGVDPSLVAGEEVFVQYWSRDAGSSSGTGLTDALGFFIFP